MSNGLEVGLKILGKDLQAMIPQIPLCPFRMIGRVATDLDGATCVGARCAFGRGEGRGFMCSIKDIPGWLCEILKASK